MSVNPIHSAHHAKRDRMLPIACAGALGAAAVWAFWPVAPQVSDIAEATDATIADLRVRPTPPPLDLAAFSAPLWIVEAPPPPPRPAPPPPPPLKLQLLAIVRDGETHRAAIYDPDSDTLGVVGAGEQIGRRMVQSVASDAVEIRDGARNHRLTLSPEAGGRR